MRILFWLSLLLLAATAQAVDFYVAPNGSDSAPGTMASPFRTIQHAADLAQCGDVITVRAGIYRERVDPPRGGESNSKRIIYQAAPGEKVIITGAEPVSNWVKVDEVVWKATLPNSFFHGFNPYTNVLHGDWFNPLGRVHHSGAVYVNGNWLTEAVTLNAVLAPVRTNSLWFARVDNQDTTIWAQFSHCNPNRQNVEINARQTVFYPSKTGINYITVRGFTLEDAATPWAPPTAEQIGLIGTHWSRGWIIESNVVRYSMCAGIALGKYGDQWDNRAGTASGYVGTIRRALTNGWNKATIGHHIVRDNDISHCEQAGVVGSLGGAFSVVAGNNIHDIHVMNWFSGAEMAGIKLHGAIDVQITQNHIYRTTLGIWLDWMAQGACVADNLFHDNGRDLFLEVDHGPFLVVNNIFLSHASVVINSQGGAFVHNLFAGTFKVIPFDQRQTPFFAAHSTRLAGLHDNPDGDVRFYNNLFVRRPDLTPYDDPKLPVSMDGNVFLDGAKPSVSEPYPLVESNFDPAIRLVQKHDHYYLEMRRDKSWTDDRKRVLVTSGVLGEAIIPGLPFEMPDGGPVCIATDYFGHGRKISDPAPGPFAVAGRNDRGLEVW